MNSTVVGEGRDWVVLKVGETRVAGVYWHPEMMAGETEHQLGEIEEKLGEGKKIAMGD